MLMLKKQYNKLYTFMPNSSNLLSVLILVSGATLPFSNLLTDHLSLFHQQKTLKEISVIKHKSRNTRKVRKFTTNFSTTSVDLFKLLQTKYATANFKVALRSNSNFNYQIKYDNFDIFGTDHTQEVTIDKYSKFKETIEVAVKFLANMKIKIGTTSARWNKLSIKSLTKLDLKDVNPLSINYYVDSAGSKSSPSINLYRSYTKRNSKNIITDVFGFFDIYNLNNTINHFFQKTPGGIFIDILIPIIALHVLGSLISLKSIYDREILAKKDKILTKEANEFFRNSTYSKISIEMQDKNNVLYTNTAYVPRSFMSVDETDGTIIKVKHEDTEYDRIDKKYSDSWDLDAKHGRQKHNISQSYHDTKFHLDREKAIKDNKQTRSKSVINHDETDGTHTFESPLPSEPNYRHIMGPIRDGVSRTTNDWSALFPPHDWRANIYTTMQRVFKLEHGAFIRDFEIIQDIHHPENILSWLDLPNNKYAKIEPDFGSNLNLNIRKNSSTDEIATDNILYPISPLSRGEKRLLKNVEQNVVKLQNYVAENPTKITDGRLFPWVRYFNRQVYRMFLYGESRVTLKVLENMENQYVNFIYNGH